MDNGYLKYDSFNIPNSNPINNIYKSRLFFNLNMIIIIILLNLWIRFLIKPSTFTIYIAFYEGLRFRR